MKLIFEIWKVIGPYCTVFHHIGPIRDTLDLSGQVYFMLNFFGPFSTVWKHIKTFFLPCWIISFFSLYNYRSFLTVWIIFEIFIFIFGVVYSHFKEFGKIWIII